MTDLPALLREVLQGQQEILAELQELRAAVAARPGRKPTCSAEDLALVQAIHLAVGSRAFVASEIIDYMLAPRMKGAAEICAALRAAIAEPDSRRLGKLLKRLDGLDLDGFRVVRVGEDREGAVWSVERELRE